MKPEAQAALSAAISALQALLNQQFEAANATNELLKRFNARQAAGEEWTGADIADYFDHLQRRDDAVRAGGV